MDRAKLPRLEIARHQRVLRLHQVDAVGEIEQLLEG